MRSLFCQLFPVLLASLNYSSAYIFQVFSALLYAPEVSIYLNAVRTAGSIFYAELYNDYIFEQINLSVYAISCYACCYTA
jgi:hypothetical protein